MSPSSGMYLWYCQRYAWLGVTYVEHTLHLYLLQVHEATQARIQAALATASQEHAAARGELKRQVDELSAKVAEAAGALRAKEELKEEK